MSKLNKTDAERGERLSSWAEGLDTIPEDAVVTRGRSIRPGHDLLVAALGSGSAVDRAIGRPTLSGRTGAGNSPVRQVRLPRELDALLIDRAQEEHRTPSELMRAALVAYLTKAS